MLWDALASISSFGSQVKLYNRLRICPDFRLLRPQGEVVALDVQAGMLARTRDRVDAAGLENVRYPQAELHGGRLPANDFDR